MSIALKRNAKIAKKLAVAMQVVADVARIYKKYGQSAVWHPIEPAYSPPRRAERLANETGTGSRPTCGICGKRFIAPTSERCQCRVAIKTRK